MNHELASKFTLSEHQTVTVRQSTAPLQLKCFEVFSKMAIVASAPVLLNWGKKQCCKIVRFTDAPCINVTIGTF
jgi:hypothetical protein